jgi:hypothetical protein
MLSSTRLSHVHMHCPPPQVNVNEDEALQETDLTFEGAYVPGNSTYIVHVIGLPFIPKGTNLKLDDDGPAREFRANAYARSYRVSACRDC